MSSKSSLKSRLPWRRNKDEVSTAGSESFISLRASRIQESETTFAFSSPRSSVLSSGLARLEKDGLFRLYPVNENVEITFGPDVIAVHGLNGDAYGTWTHENKKLWLRDFLPTKLPNARVFTFGYSSEVAFTKSRGKVDEFARSLLNALKRMRRAQASQALS